MRRTVTVIGLAGALALGTAMPASAGTAKTCRSVFAPEFSAYAVLDDGVLLVDVDRTGAGGYRAGVDVYAAGRKRSFEGTGYSKKGPKNVGFATRTSRKTVKLLIDWGLYGPDVTCVTTVRA